MTTKTFPLEDIMAVRASAVDRLLDPHMSAYAADTTEGGAPFCRVGSVAVVTIDGPLAQRLGWWWDGYDAIKARFGAALGDSSTSVVVLRINSPGGMVSGCFDAVRDMRVMARESGKRVLAFADEMACSAAYALATVADEIWLPETGAVGSVGVIGVMVDRTKLNEAMGFRVQVITSGKRKADGHPDRALTADAIDRYRERIDSFANIFATLVAETRPLTANGVLALEADVFDGPRAVSANLADGVTSFSNLLQSLNSVGSTKGITMNNSVRIQSSHVNPRRALTEEEQHVCRVTGMSEAAFLAARAAEEATGVNGSISIDSPSRVASTSALTEEERRVCRVTGRSEAEFLAAKREGFAETGVWTAE